METLFPVRCYTCGKVLGSKQIPYENLIREGYHPKQAMDALGIKRICCRAYTMCPIQIAAPPDEMPRGLLQESRKPVAPYSGWSKPQTLSYSEWYNFERMKRPENISKEDWVVLSEEEWMKMDKLSIAEPRRLPATGALSALINNNAMNATGTDSGFTADSGFTVEEEEEMRRFDFRFPVEATDEGLPMGQAAQTFYPSNTLGGTLGGDENSFLSQVSAIPPPQTISQADIAMDISLDNYSQLQGLESQLQNLQFQNSQSSLSQPSSFQPSSFQSSRIGNLPGLPGFNPINRQTVLPTIPTISL